VTFFKRLWLLVLLVLAAHWATQGLAQVSALRRGVVKIVVSSPVAKTGAGIIVRRDAQEAWVVTAAHVVMGADRISMQFFGGGSLAAEARHIEHDDSGQQGLALLRVAGTLTPEAIALPLAADFTAVGGEQVNMIGHQASIGDWGILTGTVSGRKGREMVIQAPIQEQTSGGPVIFKNRVVALMQRKDPSGSFGYAVTAQVIREYVQGNHVPYVVINGPKPLYAPFKTGDVFQECSECPEMVVIPEGSFSMGSLGGLESNEQPQHRVRIPSSFAVGRYEITFGEWDACKSAGGCRYDPPADVGRGRWPVVYVSWHDAAEYVAWLSKKTGARYRLLSEAEWEYAARAGSATQYPWGDAADHNRANFAVFVGGSWRAKSTAPVGSFEPNRFGLYDMIGNVYEWVQDCWNDSYSGAPSDGSAWESGNCGQRVLRGGDWYREPYKARSAHRFHTEPRVRVWASGFGFRVARTL
jgi:formylglycine-generating enzyme required for sulfatase activity